MSLDLKKGMLLSHRYQLEESLGEGGMGEVWRVTDLSVPSSDRNRALKLLKKTSEKALSRFHQEALTLQGLEHNHVVRFLHLNVERGETPYIVTEYLPGGTLEQLLKDAKTLAGQPGYLPSGLSRKLLLDLMRDTAQGLAYIHSRSVAHRDLKPANLLLLEPKEKILHENRATVKLADFGIALGSPTQRGQHTSAGAFIGTFAYAAPEYLEQLLKYTRERASGKDVEWQHRSLDALKQQDVFALGLILYELWTGKSLIVRGQQPDSEVDLQIQTLEAIQKGLSRIEAIPMPPEGSDPLLSLLKGMLAREPQKRPSAEVVAQRLERLCNPLAEPRNSSWSEGYVGKPITERSGVQQPVKRPSTPPAPAPQPTVYGSAEVVAKPAPQQTVYGSAEVVAKPAPQPRVYGSEDGAGQLIPHADTSQASAALDTHPFPSKNMPAPMTTDQLPRRRSPRVRGRYVILMVLVALGALFYGLSQMFGQELGLTETMEGRKVALQKPQENLTASLSTPGSSESPSADSAPSTQAGESEPGPVAKTAANLTPSTAANLTPSTAATAQAAPPLPTGMSNETAAAPQAPRADTPPDAASSTGKGVSPVKKRPPVPAQPPPPLEKGVMLDHDFEALKGSLSWPMAPVEMLVKQLKIVEKGQFLLFGSKRNNLAVKSPSSGYVVQLLDDAWYPDKKKLARSCLIVRHAERYYGYVCGADPAGRQVDPGQKISEGQELTRTHRGTEITYALYRVSEWKKAKERYTPSEEGRELLPLKEWLSR